MWKGKEEDMKNEEEMENEEEEMDPRSGKPPSSLR